MPNISFRKQNAIKQLDKRGYAELRKTILTNEQKTLLWSPGLTIKDVCTNILYARQNGFLPDKLLHELLKSSSTEEQIEIYKKMGDGINPWILLTKVSLKRVLPTNPESV
jgi:hypothetical protein